MPPGQVGDLLVTDGAETVLRLPEIEEPLPTAEIGFHLHAEACFEVHLPRGIIGVGGRLNLGVALYGHGGGVVEILLLSLAIGRDCGAMKDPVPVALGREVFLGNPASMFVRVSSLRPTPEGRKDCGIDFGEGPLTCTVAVIGRPAADDRVELDNEMSGRGLLIGPDEGSNFLQHGMGILFGRDR